MNNFDPTSEEPQDELRKLRFLKKQEESRARKAARNKAWYERQKAKREKLLEIRLTIVKSQQSVCCVVVNTYSFQFQIHNSISTI